jgi:hypothetical protein
MLSGSLILRVRQRGKRCVDCINASTWRLDGSATMKPSRQPKKTMMDPIPATPPCDTTLAVAGASVDTVAVDHPTEPQLIGPGPWKWLSSLWVRVGPRRGRLAP